jgi:hypothetical protein
MIVIVSLMYTVCTSIQLWHTHTHGHSLLFVILSSLAAANNGDSLWPTTNCHYSLPTQDWTELLTPELLQALASTVILGSELHGTHDHILLSDVSGSLQTITASNNFSLVVCWFVALETCCHDAAYQWPPLPIPAFSCHVTILYLFQLIQYLLLNIGKVSSIHSACLSDIWGAS